MEPSPSQRPLPEQVQASNLHWSRPDPATSVGPGLRQQLPQEQAHASSM